MSALMSKRVLGKLGTARFSVPCEIHSSKNDYRNGIHSARRFSSKSSSSSSNTTNLLNSRFLVSFLLMKSADEPTQMDSAKPPGVYGDLETPQDQQPAQKKLVGQVHYEYVIIGSGTAAYTALEAIRQSRPKSSILLISEEHQMPRIDVDTFQDPLPDELYDVYNDWRRHIACKLDTDERTELIGANVRKWSTRGSSGSIIGGGPQGKQQDDKHHAISLLVEAPGGIFINAKCLVAPPGKPRELYVLKSSISFLLRDRINTLRDLQDFDDLYNMVSQGGKTVLVVGGGYLGTSLSAALLKVNQSLERPNRIIQTFVESTALQQYFPAYLCAHLTKCLEDQGLERKPDVLVTGVSRAEVSEHPPALASNGVASSEESEIPVMASPNMNNDDEDEDFMSPDLQEKVSVTFLQNTQREVLDADLVVLASTNVDPDVDIARISDLEVDPRTGGIVVNPSLEAFDGLFVAGSAASYYDVSLSRRRRNDLYDNALNTGLLAGQNMVAANGNLRKYKHQPSFRFALPNVELSFEAVGEINSNLPTMGTWLAKRDEMGKPTRETSYERGIVFYLRNNIVVGILCCNASECLDVARDVLKSRMTFEEASKLILLAPSNWTKTVKTK
eukprot:CAMPEP_0171507092 /NCGR_PEP_ID=MMETSP0958-20121227/13308_1 /TAXON_ID=87120 /ORGANISM="Aurantiochytrium limacinum, Strain ATCCMYA-1381" /LENGTH=616 /DNA_ID=CAMNT_0012043753 /DNA_START=364 /DNA_END=2214 /DNA_ORIENTATION=+